MNADALERAADVLDSHAEAMLADSKRHASADVAAAMLSAYADALRAVAESPKGDEPITRPGFYEVS